VALLDDDHSPSVNALEYVWHESLNVLMSLEWACDIYDNEWMIWSCKSKALRAQMLLCDEKLLQDKE